MSVVHGFLRIKMKAQLHVLCMCSLPGPGKGLKPWGDMHKRRVMALVQKSLTTGRKEVVEVPAWSPDRSSHVTWEPHGGR